MSLSRSNQQFAAEVASHIDCFLQLRGLSQKDRLVFALAVERNIIQQLNEEPSNERSYPEPD